MIVVGDDLHVHEERVMAGDDDLSHEVQLLHAAHVLAGIDSAKGKMRPPQFI